MDKDEKAVEEPKMGKAPKLPVLTKEQVESRQRAHDSKVLRMEMGGEF